MVAHRLPLAPLAASLMGQPFANPVVGGGGALVIPLVRSPNFSLSAQTGWAIMSDGQAYFFDVTAEGTITANAFDGTDFAITPAGAFFYSGTPAAGNLIASICSAAGTDAYGNATFQGVCNYYVTGGVAYATILVGAVVSWHTAASQAGPYGFAGNIGISSASPTTFVIDFGAIEGVINAPVSAPSITTLPDDTNSGTTWVGGERAFMNNNWVAVCNANFVAIAAALAAAGITL